MSTMQQGRYVGLDVELKAKTALLRKHDDPQKVLAQFDDLECPLSSDWHEFERRDFKIIRELNV